MNQPPGTGSLAAALVAAQNEMPAVEKDGKNPHFNSRFTTLDELIGKTRPKLSAHGLAIVQQPILSETGHPILRTILIHSSGEQLQVDTPLYLGRQDMQAFGAAVTYARRYAWAALLGVAAEEDTDGEPAPAAPPPAKAITDAQKKKIGAVVTQLDRDGCPIPQTEFAEADTWVDVLRMELDRNYGVQTRTALTAAQASRLIDWLEAQAVPF